MDFRCPGWPSLRPPTFPAMSYTGAGATSHPLNRNSSDEPEFGAPYARPSVADGNVAVRGSHTAYETVLDDKVRWAFPLHRRDYYT